MPATEGKGMPVPKGLDVQTQYSPIGEQALPFHHALLWLSVFIAVFVLGLLVGSFLNVVIHRLRSKLRRLFLPRLLM